MAISASSACVCVRFGVCVCVTRGGASSVRVSDDIRDRHGARETQLPFVASTVRQRRDENTRSLNYFGVFPRFFYSHTHIYI